MNNITINTENYIVRFFDGSRITVGEKTAMALMEKSTTGIDTFTIKDRLYNFKSVQCILSEKDYYKQFPKEKEELGRSYDWKPNDLQDITEKFQWATKAFNFGSMFELVVKTHKELSKLNKESEFIDFCIKHKALVVKKVLEEKTDLFVTTATFINANQQKERVAFAYPFFLEIWRYIEDKRKNLSPAPEMTWQQIEALP